MTEEVQKSTAARNRRWGWLIAIAGIGAGLLVRAVAFVTVARGGTDSLQLPFIAASAVVLAGLFMIVRADRFVWTRGLTEAATLTTGALALLMWVGIVQPYVARAALDESVRRVSELSLVVDLCLAVALVCWFSRRPTRTRASLALSVGAVCHVVSDVAFVVATAQHGGEVIITRLVAVLGLYALCGVVVFRATEGPPAPAQVEAPAVFDPLVGVVLVNSVTVVLAGLHEDRVGALMVAAGALVITAVAALAQWKLHAANESMLRAVDAERTALREENMTLLAAHAVATETLASTSHFLEEMTTRVAGPLNGVLEAADRIRDPELDKSGDVLLALMNELLGVSTDAVLAPALTEATFSLRSVLAGAVGPYTEAAAAKGLAFNTHIDDSVPEMVRGDRQRLAELLGLFADNAVGYTSRGVVNVAVNFVELRNEDEYVVYFEMTDSGPGLSPYDCYRAFEFDVRAEPHKRRYRGNLRGLTKARMLVEQFGGLYGVESELGSGASFWFTVALRTANLARDRAAVIEPVATQLAPPPAPEPEPTPEPAMSEPEPEPVMSEPEPEPAPEAVMSEPEPVVHAPEPEPEAEPQPEAEARSGFLLFAEDDPLCRRITVAALRRAGYEVDTVTNGVDAVSAMAERRYDLVLMDVQLPVMTGLEATAAIRSGGANADVPIIAISAFTTERDQDDALAAGVDDFVTKPLDLDPLLSVLDRWTRQHAHA